MHVVNFSFTFPICPYHFPQSRFISSSLTPLFTLVTSPVLLPSFTSHHHIVITSRLLYPPPPPLPHQIISGQTALRDHHLSSSNLTHLQSVLQVAQGTLGLVAVQQSFTLVPSIGLTPVSVVVQYNIRYM